MAKFEALRSMPRADRRRRCAAAALLALAPAWAAAELTLTEGTNLSVDIASDGRLVMDLLGGIWIIPAGGGEAARVQHGPRPAARPRWSPDDTALVYESTAADRPMLWLARIGEAAGEPLGDPGYANRDPAWHPSGERITFAAARRASGFDLWETDLATRLSWRLTAAAGDETDPAWSNDGRHLVYIHAHAGGWSLVLRRHGEPEEVLVSSTRPLAAPSWRPDGSLVTYLREDDSGWAVWMTILSEPRLHRPLIEGEDFFLSPVVWRDRQQIVYAADGHIRTRPFDAWASVDVPFAAAIGSTGGRGATRPAARELPPEEPADGYSIVRAARVFDGTGDGYRRDVDIVIAAGRIVAIEAQAERPGEILIDVGDVTVLPGLVDGWAALPADAPASLGPLLLCLGVTTLVAETPAAAALNATWGGAALPGPRVLAAARVDEAPPAEHLPWLVSLSGGRSAGLAGQDAVREWQSRGVAVLAESWQAALASGASLVLANSTRPTSPAGHRYQDIEVASDRGGITFVSGLADAATPGLDDIWQARPSRLIASAETPPRRFGTRPMLTTAATTIVLGSRPNGLPPGIATHAELEALVAAGLTPLEALKAAGVNAAAALGLGTRLGRIAPGAQADLVLVAGDPLAAIGNARDVVAVVRGGRFYSVSGLIDRARAAAAVE